MVEGEVFGPPTSSTSGSMCAGWNGWVTAKRSGCSMSAVSSSTEMAEVVDAMSVSGETTASTCL